MELGMTQAELIIFLETLAENVELKAGSGQEAAKIIRDKIEQLKEKRAPTAFHSIGNPSDRSLSSGRLYFIICLVKNQIEIWRTGIEQNIN